MLGLVALNYRLYEDVMIIWIDGTFGIGKTAAANELLNKLPESEVIDFDEFIKRKKGGRRKTRLCHWKKNK